MNVFYEQASKRFLCLFICFLAFVTQYLFFFMHFIFPVVLSLYTVLSPLTSIFTQITIFLDISSELHVLSSNFNLIVFHYVMVLDETIDMESPDLQCYRYCTTALGNVCHTIRGCNMLSLSKSSFLLLLQILVRKLIDRE